MTLHEAIAEASQAIARRDAETLLLHLLQRDRAWLITHTDDALNPDASQTFQALTVRRAAHEPLQHLIGTQEFYGLPLRVTRDTLIPRPETEHLVEAVIAWANTQAMPPRILDVGTGTGAIALALATHLPNAAITALDISLAALDVARANAASLGLTARIRFLQSDLLDTLAPDLAAGQRFDVLVANPPYIPLTDAPTLQPEVRDHEPHTALFAGDDGLAVYRRLIPAAHTALCPGGLLAMEFGFGQRDALAALLEATLLDPTLLDATLLEATPPAWTDIRFLDDYAQIPRIALATRM